MSAKKISRMALLTAIALVIFIVELQIPNPVPIPGVKLGLSNIVTVYAVFTLDPLSAFLILLCRILLGTLLTGQAISLFFSLSGGLLCYLAMLLVKRALTLDQIWVSSVLGAIFHNIGQVLAAAVVTRTPGILLYLPVLMISGIAAGLFTGLCAQFLIKKLPKAR